MRRLRSQLAFLLLMMIVTSSSAATKTVTTLADSGPGSLRLAISNATSGDTITFSVGGTIVLTSGELRINTNLTIIGPGATNLAISGNNSSGVFSIGRGGVTSSIFGITIRDGLRDYGAGLRNVFVSSALTVSGCVFTANRTLNGANSTYVASSGADRCCTPGGNGGSGGDGGDGGDGAGVWNGGFLTVIACSFFGNTTGNGGNGTAGGRGGYGFPGGNGGAGGGGGCGGEGPAIHNNGFAIVTNCVFSGNSRGTCGLGGAGAAGGFCCGYTCGYTCFPGVSDGFPGPSGSGGGTQSGPDMNTGYNGLTLDGGTFLMNSFRRLTNNVDQFTVPSRIAGTLRVWYADGLSSSNQWQRFNNVLLLSNNTYQLLYDYPVTNRPGRFFQLRWP